MAVTDHGKPAITVLDRLAQPYFVLRPTQLVRCAQDKLRAGLARNSIRSERIVRLPWGLDLAVDPKETIGRAIVRNGLFDLNVSEALGRLLEPGETAVDVGTNIGHMTSVMAHAVGDAGRVIAFEPHPAVHRELAANVARWKGRRGLGSIELHEIALSDRGGSGSLRVHEETFARNRGSATLNAQDEGDGDAFTGSEVTLRRLDHVLDGHIHVMKIDVEGHELQVLRGARGLIERGLVRDVIFEEHNPYPTAVTELLEDAGFTLFVLDRTIFGPKLVKPREDWRTTRLEDPSVIASTAPDRVRERFRRPGWRVLRPRPRRS